MTQHDQKKTQTHCKKRRSGFQKADLRAAGLQTRRLPPNMQDSKFQLTKVQVNIQAVFLKIYSAGFFKAPENVEKEKQTFHLNPNIQEFTQRNYLWQRKATKRNNKNEGLTLPFWCKCN